MGVDNVSARGYPIDCLDKPRMFRYTFAALKYLANKHESVIKILERLSKLDSHNFFDMDTLDLITDLVYAGLIHEDKTVTLEEVQAMIDMDAMTDIIMIATKALSGSMPQVKEGSGGLNPPKA